MFLNMCECIVGLFYGKRDENHYAKCIIHIYINIPDVYSNEIWMMNA